MENQAGMTKHSSLLVLILSFGVFGIINTQMAFVGILPLIAETFHVSIPQAGWTVSVFALVVAFAAPILPLLFSGMNSKTVMLLSLGIFVIGNLISMVSTNYTVLLISRAIPAFFHPVYVSMAFTVAAMSVAKKEDAPKAVSKVFVGVSAGMVLGVPITNFIAGETSFVWSMFFLAFVNAVTFVATLIFVPSMPATKKQSYGNQLVVLKKSITWFSIIAVILLNSAIYGFFSYLSDFLENITKIDFRLVSVMLFIYGAANIVGNVIAGKLLARKADISLRILPFALFATYALLFVMGELTVPMACIILVLGILAGIAANSAQFMITNAAHEAPTFANGLFLTSANLGTAIGTAICGLFISGMGTEYVVVGTLLFLVGCAVFVFARGRSPVYETEDEAMDFSTNERR